MDEKKNAERYLVIQKYGPMATVWASTFADVLKELNESGIEDDDVIQITKLDV